MKHPPQTNVDSSTTVVQRTKRMQKSNENNTSIRKHLVRVADRVSSMYVVPIFRSSKSFCFLCKRNQAGFACSKIGPRGFTILISYATHRMHTSRSTFVLTAFGGGLLCTTPGLPLTHGGGVRNQSFSFSVSATHTRKGDGWRA